MIRLVGGQGGGLGPLIAGAIADLTVGLEVGEAWLAAIVWIKKNMAMKQIICMLKISLKILMNKT